MAEFRIDLKILLVRCARPGPPACHPPARVPPRHGPSRHRLHSDHTGVPLHIWRRRARCDAHVLRRLRLSPQHCVSRSSGPAKNAFVVYRAAAPYPSFPRCSPLFLAPSWLFESCTAHADTPATHSLEDNGVITDCSIKTLEPEALPDMNISNAQVPCNIIMKVTLCSGVRACRLSSATSRPASASTRLTLHQSQHAQSKWLTDVFQQMDTSSDTLQFTIAPTAPFFRLATQGLTGTSEVCSKEADGRPSPFAARSSPQSFPPRCRYSAPRTRTWSSCLPATSRWKRGVSGGAALRPAQSWSCFSPPRLETSPGTR